MERAKVLFGSYRRGDANDPDSYVASVSAVLSIYDADLMREVTDPRTGIQTTEKYMSFMPNAGELKVYCDGVLSHRLRIERLGALPAVKPVAFLPAPQRQPGDLATTFVPQSNPRYQSFVDWSKTADERHFRFDDKRPGIWVQYEAFENRSSIRPRDETWKRPENIELTDQAKRATGIQVEPEDVA